MAENTNQETTHTNPFFIPYNTPHDTVPFPNIRLEHYEEAFMEGIRRDDEMTDKIVNDPAAPTFENTIARVDEEKCRDQRRHGGIGTEDEPHTDETHQRHQSQQAAV